MGRRSKRKNRETFILILLVIILGVILILGKYYKDKEEVSNNDNKEIKENTKVDNSTKKEDTNENKEKTKANEEKKEETKTENIKSSSDELKENVNEVSRRGGHVTLELIGEDDITVEKGSKYEDAGVKAYYDDGSNAIDEVEVDSDVDTSKEGSYTVSYYVGNSVVIRRVRVK